MDVHELINAAYSRKGLMNKTGQSNIIVTGIILPISEHSDIINSITLWNNSRLDSSFDRLKKYPVGTDSTLYSVLMITYAEASRQEKVLVATLTG